MIWSQRQEQGLLKLYSFWQILGTRYTSALRCLCVYVRSRTCQQELTLTVCLQLVSFSLGFMGLHLTTTRTLSLSAGLLDFGSCEKKKKSIIALQTSSNFSVRPLAFFTLEATREEAKKNPLQKENCPHCTHQATCIKMGLFSHRTAMPCVRCCFKCE